MFDIKRKKYIINPKLQYLVPLIFAFTSFINLVFFIIANSVIKTKIITDAKSLDALSFDFLNQYVSGTMSTLAQAVIAFNVFSIIISFVLGSMLLNHIAGPIFAIKKQIDDMADGKKPQRVLKLRKYDFFTDVADSVNRLEGTLKLEKQDPKS